MTSQQREELWETIKLLLEMYQEEEPSISFLEWLKLKLKVGGERETK